MRTVIIGYAGFLGRVLTSSLLAQGHEVFGIAPRPSNALPEVPFIPFDAAEDVPPIPEGVDAVFYLAQSPYYRDFPLHCRHLFSVNALGAVTAAAAAAAAGVSFFLYASTGNVYAPSFAPMSEDAPLSRDSAYGLSKLMGEEALRLFKSDMSIINARFFGLFGPGQQNMMPARMLQAVREGSPVFLEPRINGKMTGGVRISFLYVEDCAAILMRLAHKGISGESLPRELNIAGPRGVPLRELVETMGRLEQRETRIISAPTVRRTDYVANIGRLCALLAPTFTPLDEALRRMCAWNGGV